MRFIFSAAKQDGSAPEATATGVTLPVQSHSALPIDDERMSLARHFPQETLRLSMYGSLDAAKFPDIAARPTENTVDRGTVS